MTEQFSQLVYGLKLSVENMYVACIMVLPPYVGQCHSPGSLLNDTEHTVSQSPKLARGTPSLVNSMSMQEKKSLVGRPKKKSSNQSQVAARENLGATAAADSNEKLFELPAP
jgi:hypothetical protein